VFIPWMALFSGVLITQYDTDRTVIPVHKTSGLFLKETLIAHPPDLPIHLPSVFLFVLIIT
jgi:hypothetical protein